MPGAVAGVAAAEGSRQDSMAAAHVPEAAACRERPTHAS